MRLIVGIAENEDVYYLDVASAFKDERDVFKKIPTVTECTLEENIITSGLTTSRTHTVTERIRQHKEHNR